MYRLIEERLKAKGMTFADLSRETGIPNPSFTRLKQKGGNLSFANCAKVAAVLGISMEDLVDKRRQK